MPVSVPLRWDELQHVYSTDFTPDRVMERLSGLGDLWHDILDHKSDLHALVTRPSH
jgi:DNA primase